MKMFLKNCLQWGGRLWSGRDDPFFTAANLGYREGIRACIVDRRYRKNLSAKSDGFTILFILYHPCCYRIYRRLLQDPRLGSMEYQVRILSLNPQHGDDFLYPCSYSLSELLESLKGCRVGIVMQSSDFEAYRGGAHQKGCALGDYFERFGALRMVVQHGGSRGDSMNFLSSTGSKIICVWGELAAKTLGDLGISSDRIRVVGNISRDPQEIMMAEQAPVHPSVLIAGCVHSEYPDVIAGEGAYQDWLERAIRLFLPMGKVRLRRHPMDELLAPGVCELIVNTHFSLDEVEIVSTEETIEESLRAAGLVVSRASTVLEEGLLRGSGAVAVDFCRHPYLISQEMLSAIPGFECYTFEELEQDKMKWERVAQVFRNERSRASDQIKYCHHYLDDRDPGDPLIKILSVIKEFAK